MMDTTVKKSNEPTPNGGVRSECHFLDASGQPIDEKQAVQARVLEFDKDGNIIKTTYADLQPPQSDDNDRA